MWKDELRATIREPWVLLALAALVIVLLLPLTTFGR
jgi:hypothetical protein